MGIHQHAGVLPGPLRCLRQDIPFRLVEHGWGDIQLLQLGAGGEVAPDLVGKIAVRLHLLQTVIRVLRADYPVIHQGVQREQRTFTHNGAIRFRIAVGHPLLHRRAGAVQVDIIPLAPDGIGVEQPGWAGVGTGRQVNKQIRIGAAHVMQQSDRSVKIRGERAALNMRIGITHPVELERGNVLVFDKLNDLLIKVFKIVRA